MPGYAISIKRVCDDSPIYWLVIATIDLPQPGFTRERLVVRTDTEQEALAVAGEIVGSGSRRSPHRCPPKRFLASVCCRRNSMWTCAGVHQSVVAGDKRRNEER